MRTNDKHSKLSRIARSLLVAGGVLLTSLVVFAPATEARDHRDAHSSWQKGHGNGHGNGHGRGHQSYRFTEVPRRMHGHYRSDFRYAYAGRTYYGPHHHYHAMYRYPVVVGGVVRYRPYYYCNDELFVTGYVPLPRVVVGVNIRPGIHVYADAY
jgi:hypothetical protein